MPAPPRYISDPGDQSDPVRPAVSLRLIPHLPVTTGLAALAIAVSIAR